MLRELRQDIVTSEGHDSKGIMEIPVDMFDWPPLQPPLKRFHWAILFLPHSTENPFIKVPLVYDTYLGAMSSIGLDQTTRLHMHKGDVAYHVFATFKIYLLLEDTFFKHLDSMVEIANAFYKYCFSDLDPNMAPDTAYSLCTSILPPVTREDYGIHVLLTALEVKVLTKSEKELKEIESVYFPPSPMPEKALVW